LAIGSTATKSRLIPLAASLFCPVIRRTSTGRSPASTSPRLRQSVH
jgi:hypothetical protein